MKALKPLAIAALAAALGACSSVLPEHQAASQPTIYNGGPSFTPRTFGDLTYRAIDNLVASVDGALQPGDPLVVASIVNVDDVDTSSSFGRIVAEQAATRMTQLGYTVTEVKLRRNAIKLSPTEGQLALSRHPEETRGTAAAKAVLTGSYAIGGSNVYVTLHLVSPTTAQVLAAVDFVAPLNGDLRPMVSARGTGRR